METLEESAQEIGRVLVREYDKLKFDARCTPWGIAYFWDRTKGSFADQALGENHGFIIEHIIDGVKKSPQFTKPQIYIPKRRDPIAHYSLCCLRNRDLFTQGFLRFLREDKDKIEDLVDDRRLLHESLCYYVSYSEGHQIPKSINLVDFLLHHNPATSFTESKNPQGVYRNLLERLAIRFEGMDIIHELEHISEQKIYEKMRKIHKEALAQSRIQIDPSLIALYRKYASSDTCDNEEDYSTPSRTVTLQSFLGKRRVRKGSKGGLFIDWAQLEEEHALQQHVGKLLDPNRVLFHRLRNRVIEYYVGLYREKGRDALENLRRATETTEGEEQKVLNTTLRILQSIDLLITSTHINHEMIIQKRSN